MRSKAIATVATRGVQRLRPRFTARHGPARDGRPQRAARVGHLVAQLRRQFGRADAAHQLAQHRA
ncbi:hypothetical protein J7S33_04770, partial [Saccharothrix algeriensis]